MSLGLDASQSSSGPPNDNYAIVGEIGESPTGKPDDFRDWNQMIEPADFFRQFLASAQIASYTELGGYQRVPVPPRQRSI